MKNRMLYISGLLVLTALLFTASCKKEDVAPVVTITSVNPAAAYGGDEVILQGENLHTVKYVFVADKHAEIVGASESSITFIVPTNALPGPAELTLAMLDNYRVSNDFEVLQRPIPSIEAISPSGAAPGEEVTIVGMNLDILTSVTVGGAEASVVSATNTELVFTVPSGLPLNTPAEIELSTQEVAIASASIFYVGENKITNSDFEAGSGDDFDGWEKLNGGDQMTEVAGEEAYFGRSIRIVGANNPDQPWRTQLASAEMNLNFNSEYTVIMWAKAEAEGAIMRVSASQFNHHGAGSDYFYGEDMAIPTEWTQLAWTFTVGADLPSHKLVLDMGHTDVPFLIDNVTLIETGAAGPPIPDNLLANPGFEDGLESWELLNGAIEATTEDAHCGAQSIKITPAGGNPWDQQIAASPVQLAFGGQYEIRLWAKGAAEGAIMRVSISKYDGNGADYFYGSDVTLTTEWAEYTWNFEVTNDLPEHSLVLDMGAGAQAFYVDDVSLKEYVEPVNILEDGGFENGIYSAGAPNESASWELLNGTVEITTNPDEVFSGSQALKVTGAGGNPWDTQLAADKVPLVFEGRYGVKLMARSTAPGAVMRISASRYNDGNGDDYFYGADVSLTEEWAEYSWEFTVGKDIPDGHHIVLDMGASAQAFFVDEVVLYEVQEFECP